MQKIVIFPKKTKNYYMPTKIFFGRGEIMKTPNLIKKKKLKKILLICGSHLKKTSLLIKFINKFPDNYEINIYQDIVSKSTFSTINKLTKYCRENKFDCLIGMGGGTILDTTKAASVLSKNGGIIEDYVLFKNREIIRRGIFFIAIPTTSGTGSEVTPWSTIWGDDKKKYSLSSNLFMFPNIAIVDPELTNTLSSKTTAESGIDALCQAFESYWDNKHNIISDKHALIAIKFILGNLELAVRKKTNIARDRMAWGSMNGGLAFSNTQTNICHAISYPITGYWNIAHGQATSITLPIFIREILPYLSKNRKSKLLKIMNAKDINEAEKNVLSLMLKIGLKTKLSDLNISKKDIDIVLNESFCYPQIKNIPINYNRENLRILIESIY